MHPTLDEMRYRLTQPPTYVRLLRPCTVGDGLDLPPLNPSVSISPQRFIPASGAATRLFSSLSDESAGWTLANLKRLALTNPDELAGLPSPDSVIRRLMQGPWPQLPKALIPFHRLPSSTRTPLEGHLWESIASGMTNHCHFTVSPSHRHAFESSAEACIREIQLKYGFSPTVSFSVQATETNTIALDMSGAIIRHPDGRPHSRPGGHGALLQNLGEMSGLVRIVNIDNIAHPDHLGGLRAHSDRLVAACIAIRDERNQLIDAIAADLETPNLSAFLEKFSIPKPADKQDLIASLNRPIRVCGMVPNEGHPGGGPFWIKRADGSIGVEIVEGVEVDHADPEQEAIWSSSTHFNPVDLVCWLDGPEGEPYHLPDFVDSTRWMRTRKSHAGQKADCLEYPGLWNGSMSGWLSAFVEMPSATCNPVKTLADLLSPYHQPVASL